MDARNEVRKVIVRVGIALTCVFIGAGALGGNIKPALGLLTAGALGLGIGLYLNKRLP